MNSKENRSIYIEESRDLALRPLQLCDSPLIVRWRNNPRVSSRYIYRERFTLEGQEHYYHTMIETGRVFQYILCEKSEDFRPIGYNVLSDVDLRAHTAEAGLCIGEDSAIGRHYGWQGYYTILRIGFCQLGMEKIHARIMTDNIASCKAAERAGFTIKKTLPDVMCSDGVLRPMYYLECTRAEFLEI